MSQGMQQQNEQDDKSNISQSRLASLVGFEEAAREEKDVSFVTPQSTQEQKDIATADSQADSSSDELLVVADPRDVASSRPIWSQPRNKAYVVFAGTSILALLLYSFSNTLFKTPLRQAQKPANLQEFPAPEETQDPTGALKVETALGDQAAAIAKLKEKNHLPKSNKVVPVRPVQRVAVMPRPTTPPSRSITSLPARRFVTEPRYSRPDYPPVQRAIAPAVVRQPPAPAPVTQQPSPPVTDPMEQWQIASQIGSYSSPSSSKERSIASSNGETTSNELPRQDSPVEYASLTSNNSNQPTDDERMAVRRSPRQVDAADYQAEEDPILQERPRQFIRAGTTARAILATTLAWDESEQSLDRERVAITLSEPLVAADGAVIVPKGSQLIAQVQSHFDSGLVRLVTVAAIAEQNGEKVELDIPPTAIEVRGVEGKPLIAKKLKSDRSGSFGSDVGRVLLGAARNGTAVLNRPRQSTSFTGGGYSSSSQSSNPDFLAGAFEGASGTLLDSLEQRNRRQSEQNPKRSSAWVLKAKTKVEVFVNESVPLDLSTERDSQVVLPRAQVQQEFVDPSQIELEQGDRNNSSNLERANASSPTQYYLRPEEDFTVPNSY